MLKQNELLKKIKYFIYPLEFILMLIFMIFVYKFITIKSYEGYWSRRILICSVITGVMAIGMMVYNCIKDKDKIEKMFLNFAIPIGMMYIIFMLHSYTPDASAHIWKAYEISNGILFTKIDENGDSKTIVPEVLSVYRENMLTKYSVFNQEITSEDINNYDKTVEVDTPSKTYCFIFYIGYAIGIAVARILTLNIFTGILIARLINFGIVLVSGYYSIKLIPFGKILLLTYLMIPMLMQQATAVSADSIMNTIIILFIAYTLNLCFKENPINKRDKIIYIIFSFLVGFTKITYIPIIGLGLIIAKRRKEISKKEIITLGGISIVICLASVLLLTLLNRGYVNESAQSYLQSAGVNASEQIKGIIQNPLRYIWVLANDFRLNGEFYLNSAIGQHMGWLSIIAPNINITYYILLLVVSIFVEHNKEVLDRNEKILVLLLTVLMYVLIITGLYIQWTGVGAVASAGVQGRYFLPIMILPLLCLSRKDDYIKIKNSNILVPLSSLLINTLFIINIIKFFI